MIPRVLSSVWCHEALSRENASDQAALLPAGFSFSPAEVADWIEAIDRDQHNIAFPDFLAFVKSQVCARGSALRASGRSR